MMNNNNGLRLGTLGTGMLATILALFLCGVCGPVFMYNAMVNMREDTKTAWGQVENQYQRRMDLIPNLVATVKGAAKFEQDTFTAVAQARSQAGGVLNLNGAMPNAAQLAQIEATQGALTSALSRLMVVVERYPELKATQGFRDLQTQLEGTENRIGTERMRFNDAAKVYNSALLRFPGTIIAKFGGFERIEYFQAKPGADTPPSVDFTK